MREMTKPATKKSGGRPRVDATPVMVRIPPEQLKRLDKWISSHKGEDVSRPEAIRRILQTALAGSVGLHEQIAAQEQKLARKIPAKVSLERGMAIMGKGLAEVVHGKLVTKQETGGRKSAADPETERRPDQATGKKGGDVQNAKLTRRALVANLDPYLPRRRKP
jgi:Arc/MetJ-type ribon-helix-helix transcriptional regulator